jgi:rSAM/selenodomain-associated transferase 1
MDSLDLVERASRSSGAQALLYLSEAGELDREITSHLGSSMVRVQQGADLGERLMEAFRECLESGYREIIVLGSDSPHLPGTYVMRGFDELEKSELVVGPARDGGYYLLGATRLFPPLLTDMPWGTAQVYRETIRRARKAEISIASLPAWYDVDVPESVDQLWRDLTSRRAHEESPLPASSLRLLEGWAREGRLE